MEEQLDVETFYKIALRRQGCMGGCTRQQTDLCNAVVGTFKCIQQL